MTMLFGGLAETVGRLRTLAWWTQECESSARIAQEVFPIRGSTVVTRTATGSWVNVSFARAASAAVRLSRVCFMSCGTRISFVTVRPSPDHAQISYSDLLLIRGRAAPSLAGGAGLEAAENYSGPAPQSRALGCRTHTFRPARARSPIYL